MRNSDWSSDVCSSDLDGPHPYLRRVARQIAEEHLFHIHDLDAVGDTPRRRDAPRYRPAHLVERLGPGQDIIIDDLFDLRPDLGNRRANGIGDGGMRRPQNLRDPGPRVADQDVAAADGDHRDIALPAFHPVAPPRHPSLHHCPYGTIEFGADAREAPRAPTTSTAGPNTDP